MKHDALVFMRLQKPIVSANWIFLIIRKGRIMDDELIMIEFNDMYNLIDRLKGVTSDLSDTYNYAINMGKAISKSDDVYYGKAKDLLEQYNDNLAMRIELAKILIEKGTSFVSLCLEVSANENEEMQRIMRNVLEQRKL